MNNPWSLSMLKNFSFTRDFFIRLKGILFFVIILLLPFQFGKHFFLPFSYLFGVRVDYLAPTIYLTDLFIVFFILLHLKKLLPVVKKPLSLVFLVILLLLILFSVSSIVSLLYVLRILELLLLSLSLKEYLKVGFNKKIHSVFLPLLVGAVIELSLAILQISFHHSVGGIFYFLGERTFSISTPGIAKAVLNGVEFLRPYATFSHPNSLSGFYLLIYLFSLRLNKKFLALLSICLVLVSFSKAAIITILIIFLWSSFKKNNLSGCWLCRLSRLMVIGIIGIIFLNVQSDPTSFAKRLLLVANAVKIIISRPFFGVGPGAYLIAQNRFPSPFRDLLNQPVHNIFLLIIAEVGLLPIGLLLVKFRKDIGAFIRRDPEFFLAVLITGMVDHYWLTLEQNMLLICIILTFYSFSSWRRIS